MFCPATSRSAHGLTELMVWTLPLLLLGVLTGCGEDGLFPSTVDRGSDFNVADVVFDENYFYCKVEPEFFNLGCGPGNTMQGDTPNGCHYNVTSFRLTEYSPLVGDSCNGGVIPGVGPPAQARQNYQVSQAKMDRVPERAKLLTRPTSSGGDHPRKIFELDSPTADIIRDWATKYSTQ
jgi:hypothetical protein